VQELEAGQRITILPAGEYQVASSGMGTERQWVLWPQKIQVRPGQQATFVMDSGLRLDMPQDLGTKLWRWQVVRSGRLDQVVQELEAGQRITILPAGEYQVASSGMGTERQWVLWPQKIQVRPGQQATFVMDSGLRLDMPQDLGTKLWRWEVVRSGRLDQVVQELEADQRITILPPGEYQIGSSGIGAERQWIVWPQKVQVQSGKQILIKLDSGIRLTGPGSASSSQFQLRDAQGRVLESWEGNAVQLLPPGEYSLEARPNRSTQWKPIGRVVEVRPSGITEMIVPAL
jgi:uncharacterized protein YbdZ (MbtH family)